MKNGKKRFRPQIFSAMFLLAGIAGYSLFMGAVEVATGCTGGMIALGMKLMEGE